MSPSTATARSALATWRPNILLRVFLTCVAAAMAYGTVYLAHPDPPDAPDPGFAVACALLIVFLLTMAWRPRVRLFADRVEVRGIVLRRVIPLTEVRRVGYSRDGLDIERKDGGVTTASLVGEVGIAGAQFGMTRHADRMTVAILRQRDVVAPSAGRPEVDDERTGD